jgi:protein phosphatase
MQINVPNLSLVVLIGPTGSGKSTFARKHFLPTGDISSDACRAMVSDNEKTLREVCRDDPELLRTTPYLAVTCSMATCRMACYYR